MTEHKCFVFTFADVEVREREFCIVKAGELLPVEPKAFRVLLFLLSSPHRLVTKKTRFLMRSGAIVLFPTIRSHAALRCFGARWGTIPASPVSSPPCPLSGIASSAM